MNLPISSQKLLGNQVRINFFAKLICLASIIALPIAAIFLNLHMGYRYGALLIITGFICGMVTLVFRKYLDKFDFLISWVFTIINGGCTLIIILVTLINADWNREVEACSKVRVELDQAISVNFPSGKQIEIFSNPKENEIELVPKNRNLTEEEKRKLSLIVQQISQTNANLHVTIRVQDNDHEPNYSNTPHSEK
jgi:energy-converting hydrogenase Eha subunit A